MEIVKKTVSMNAWSDNINTYFCILSDDKMKVPFKKLENVTNFKTASCLYIKSNLSK